MYTILIFSVIGMVLGDFIAHRDFCRDFIIYPLFSMVFGIIGIFVGLLVAIALPMQTYDKHYSYDIENLQDNGSVDGQFFLGCGHIEGKMKYVFYYQEDSLYQMAQLDHDKVRIRYTDGTPKVNVTEIFPVCGDSAFINYFAVDMDVFIKTYIIDVPKGSIRNGYELDAK